MTGAALDRTPLRLAVTPGEPAGIGPDLLVRVAQSPQCHELVVYADPDMLAARAAHLGLALTIREVDYNRPPAAAPAGLIHIDPLACGHTPIPGRLDRGNAAYVLATLDRAIERCMAGQASALVTGPVHKAILHTAARPFHGHTDYIGQRCASEPPVMMLTTDDSALRVALVTVHLPLAEVPGALTRQRLGHTLRVVASALKHDFGIADPRLQVAGLNPHAGENGVLGREEIEIIEPVIAEQRRHGLSIDGPLPADTLFTPARLARADAVVAMYHDQGLPVIKHLGFGRTVNISLGLPIVRTSVDHGTALELAGRDGVDTGSLRAAVASAAAMANTRRLAAGTADGA